MKFNGMSCCASWHQLARAKAVQVVGDDPKLIFWLGVCHCMRIQQIKGVSVNRYPGFYIIDPQVLLLVPATGEIQVQRSNQNP